MWSQVLQELRRARPSRAASWAAFARSFDVWPVIAVTVLAALSGWRAQLVDRSYGAFTGCHGCFNASVAANDAMALSFLIAAIGIARCGVPRLLRLALAAAAVACIACFVADIAVFRLLNQRLLLADVLHFSGDSGRMMTVVVPWLARPEGALAAAAALVAALAAWRALASPPERPQAAHWVIAAMPVLFLGAEWPRAEYIHEAAYLNMWQVNDRIDASRPYSPEFHRMHAMPPPAALSCDRAEAQPVSVIVLVVESLSAYHSRLFSGLRDDTPNLDALAHRNSYLSAFHANGFSTEGGLIALLTGMVPIPTAGRYGSVMAFTRVRGDFHRWLRGQGYTTAFFTTGDLKLGRRDEWLRAIGIRHAEGAAHPFYRDMPRGTFNAASDGALMDRFLSWYDHERGRPPFMATLLTVATHPPFALPGVGIVGEDETVREADRQVARLAAQLQERRFFDHGILLVVGDHRAMTPLPREERHALGPAAEVRVVALAMGRTGLPRGEIEGNFQQTDLIPSLEHMLGTRSCREDWQGRFLGPDPEPARYVLHADPMQRNELTVIDREREYRIGLDGDDTRFLDGLPPLRTRGVLARVNYERMSRMQEFTVPDRAR